MKQSNHACGTDDLRINVLDKFELDFWAAQLGVSKAEIKSAVTEVGDSVTAVKRHVKLMHHA